MTVPKDIIKLMERIAKKLKTWADQNKKLIRKFSASLTGPLPPMDYERVVAYLQINNPDVAGLVQGHYEELISCAKKIDTLTAGSGYAALETATSLVGKLRFLANRLAQTLEVTAKKAREELEAEKQRGTGRNAAPAKRWGVKSILCAISAVVIFLAALLTIFHYLGWLEPVKALISKILGSK